jgi:hypothetical protein
MTEPRLSDPFERRLFELVTAYTDASAARPLDPVDTARIAMGATTAKRRSRTGRSIERPIGGRWTALAAVVVIAVAAIAIRSQPSEPAVAQPSASAPEPSAPAAQSILDVLARRWQRPIPVTGEDPWGSGFLTLTDGTLAYGRDLGAGQSRTALAPLPPDAFVVTATAETLGCRVGDRATYEWRLEGKDTVLQLAVAGHDPCAARETLVAGMWVRADLAGGIGGPALRPGVGTSAQFDPIRDPARPSRLRFTVPDGWDLPADEPQTLILHLPATGADPASSDLLIAVIADPAMIADYPPGTECDKYVDATGVGPGRDGLLDALSHRPGVDGSAPTPLTIGGFSAMQFDLRLEPSFKGTCLESGVEQSGLPLLHPSGVPGPLIGISPETAERLILVDLEGGRTLAIGIARLGPSGSLPFDALFGPAMPVVQSFTFEARLP